MYSYRNSLTDVRLTRKRTNSRRVSQVHGLMHRSKNPHSITLWVRLSNGNGTAMPRAFATFRFRDISTFVLCWTGGSPGFSPFKMRAT
jgi:hypothetical protein